MTREKLLQFVWKVLINLPYLSYISPLDIHLFQSLQNSLNGKKFSIPWKTVKGTWKSSLIKKIKSLGRWNYEVAWKMAEGHGTTWLIPHSAKILVKMKTVFYSYLKNWRRVLANPIFSFVWTLIVCIIQKIYPLMWSLPNYAWHFHQTRKNNPKIWNQKKKKKEFLLKPEEKEQSWRHKPSRLQMIWQSYSNQNSESELPSQATTVFAWSSRNTWSCAPLMEDNALSFDSFWMLFIECCLQLV